jgi:hypothetical protein
MNKITAPLIFAFLSLTTALSAYAVNEFRRPVIIPPLYFNDLKRCQMLRIESTAVRGSQSYVQNGVGWIVKGDEGLRVLTPAHVISGADQVTGNCLGRSFRLRLLGKTETKDLALLAIQEPAGDLLFPIIELKAKNTTTVSTIDHFVNPFALLIQHQIYSDYMAPEEIPGKGPLRYRAFENDTKTAGLAHFQKGLNSLVAETLAIRPGYSGAPLMIEIAVDYDSANAQPGYLKLQNLPTMGFLIGMLNKVEINGSRSLGVSIVEILEILPDLWNSTSTTRDVYVDRNKGNLSLRYQNNVVKNELQRSQELVVKNRNGTETIYTEVCVDANLESSAWVPTKDRAKSITQSSKGGDYGEGGGGSVSLKNSVLMTATIENIFSLASGNLTSYKRIGSCEKVMLKDNNGRFYDSFNINGRLTKTTNLAELYDALSKLNSPGSKPRDHGNCAPYYLEFMDGLLTFYSDGGRKYSYYRAENFALSDQSQTYATGPKDDYSGFMRCYKDTALHEIYFKNVTYVFHGVFGDSKQVQGLIQFEGPSRQCSLELSEDNYRMANRWKHQIRSKYMDIDVNIGNEGRILGIKFLKVSNKCRTTYEEVKDREIWMGEENFSTPEEISNSQAPNSWVRRAVEK